MRFAKVALVLGGLAFISTSALAQDPVEDRRKLMKGVGKAMGLSVKMLKGEITFDGAQLAGAMKAASEVPDKFVKLFPKGTDLTANSKSEAKPNIWENMKDFNDKANALKIAATAAAAAAPNGKGAYAAAFKKVGATCGGCHKVYRQKKEK